MRSGHNRERCQERKARAERDKARRRYRIPLYDESGEIIGAATVHQQPLDPETEEALNELVRVARATFCIEHGSFTCGCRRTQA